MKLSRTEKTVLYDLQADSKNCVVDNMGTRYGNAITKLVNAGILKRHAKYTQRFILCEGLSVRVSKKKGSHLLPMYGTGTDVKVIETPIFEIAKTYTWGSTYLFSNAFNNGIGEDFTINEMLQIPKKGDIIEVFEFNLSKFRNKANRNDKAIKFATGRKMIIECVDIESSHVSMEHGMPMTTKNAKGKFRVLEKFQPENFDFESIF